GFAFVLEFHADGSRWVIAHPKADILTRPIRRPDKESGTELVPLAQVPDPILQGFTDYLPKTLPSDAEEHLLAESFAVNGKWFLGGYRSLSGAESPDWLICTVIPEADVMDRVQRNNRHTVFLGVIIFVLAIGISLYGSSQVARPLERLEQEANAIGRLHLEPRSTPRSLVREVDRLARAFEEMKTGLRSFQKYVA